MPSPIILAIDQGTTSSRALLYDADAFTVLASAQQEIEQHYPRDGWVEHEPEDLWYSVARTVREAVARSGCDPKLIAAVGITNQRETVIVWDRATGRPAGRAIVWQDRRTTEFCRERIRDQDWLRARTGLVLDPYFSATKLRWMLSQRPELRARAEDGSLAAGTVDSFLIWRLTGGTVHATDTTNASRTMLLNLKTLNWDADLLHYFDVPRALLPEINPSAASFGATRGLDFLPDCIPIRGVAGDQQAALFGQGCTAPGEAKCTYGTGAFFLMHTGEAPVSSRHKLLTTAAAMIDARPQYALEGAVFVAGAAVQWLRDGLRLFQTSAEVERLSRESNSAEPVVFVPAFVGLGAPHWVPEARGVIFGLTRATTAADLARAALEGVACQVVDLIEAAENDATDANAVAHAPAVPASGGASGASAAGGSVGWKAMSGSALKVDGGMAANDWFLQCQADLMGRPVARAVHQESTALGAAFLAALGAYVTDEKRLAAIGSSATRFEPAMATALRDQKLAAWRKAVKAVIGFYAG